jgi:hypothetical protein
VKDTLGEEEAAEVKRFGALGGGWFHLFQMRHAYNNTKIEEAAVIARIQAPDTFSAELGKISDEGGCSSTQVFNADERDVHWKSMPPGAYISSLQRTK